MLLIFLSFSGSPVNVTLTVDTTTGAASESSPPSPALRAFFASRFFLCFKAAFDGVFSPANDRIRHCYCLKNSL